MSNYKFVIVPLIFLIVFIDSSISAIYSSCPPCPSCKNQPTINNVINIQVNEKTRTIRYNENPNFITKDNNGTMSFDVDKFNSFVEKEFEVQCAYFVLHSLAMYFS